MANGDVPRSSSSYLGLFAWLLTRRAMMTSNEGVPITLTLAEGGDGNGGEGVGPLSPLVQGQREGSKRALGWDLPRDLEFDERGRAENLDQDPSFRAWCARSTSLVHLPHHRHHHHPFFCVWEERAANRCEGGNAKQLVARASASKHRTASRPAAQPPAATLWPSLSHSLARNLNHDHGPTSYGGHHRSLHLHWHGSRLLWIPRLRQVASTSQCSTRR